MKGIIIEKNRDHSVLLLSDGTFKTVGTTDGLELGTEMDVANIAKQKVISTKKLVSMIAAVFVIAFLGVGSYTWITPVQYINIDINPSVELAVNRFDRIIKITPLNDDGKKVISTISLTAKKYESGINQVIETAKNMGYLHEGEGGVLISISSSENERKEKTQAEIEKKITEKVEVLTFDTEEHHLSIKNGLSPGKNNIIERVIESGTDLSEKELAEESVKELMLKIKENRKTGKEQEKNAEEREKEAKKEQEKEAKKEQEKEAKEREKEAKEKEKEAKEREKEAKEQEKEAKKQEKEAKKEQETEAREREKEAKEQEKEAKKQEKEAKKEQETEAREREKEAKEQEKEAKKQEKEAKKEQETEAREREKEAKEQEKEAKKQEKEAKKEQETEAREREKEAQQGRKGSK